MFSYLSRIYNYVTGVENNSSNENINSLEDDTTENETVVHNIETKNTNGKITSYFNNVGLINDYIYFTANSVIGDTQPNVGEEVFAEITRPHPHAGWIAKKVQIINLWDNDEVDAKPFKDTLIGIVTKIERTTLVIELNSNNISFSKSKLKNDFKAFVGDWVKVDYWNKPNEENVDITAETILISPLREKKIHGVVTDIFNGYGLIDTDVFFPFSTCERGYYSKKGDRVVAMVIESKQKRGEWRSVSVFPLKNKNTESTSVLHNEPKVSSAFVEIPEKIEFGDVSLSDTKEEKIYIRNRSEDSVLFYGAEIIGETTHIITIKMGTSSCTESDQGHLIQPTSTLQPLEEKYLILQFLPKFLGRSSITIQFHFSGFVVERPISVNVIDKFANTLQGSQYQKKTSRTFFGHKVNTRFSETSVVPGQRPARKKKIFLPNKLARYPIPVVIRDCLLNNPDNIEILVPELCESLHISNYKKKFSTVLYIEEMQMNLEMRQYDMFDIVLRRNGEYLRLEVPGLAEGRPSLMLGDKVIVTYADNSDCSPSYEGIVHEIHAESIHLKFSDSFHETYRHQELNAEFYFNRTPLRRCHQAIEHAMNFDSKVLFPTCIIPKKPLVNTSIDPINFVNKILNERQRLAVERIVQAHARPIPYVLFGPPGTGKSVTVVEAILQVFKKIKHSRILACAPSNSAADLIAERLHDSGIINKHHMIRLNAFQRNDASIPDSITGYCINEIDDLKFIMKHRIIICTCSMSGYLYSLDLKVGHFTHIFVDEAGQATEPECLIPIGFAAGSEESQVILAGDPYQLGPVLRSELSEEFGLNISFLERLTSFDLYKRNEELFSSDGMYNPMIVTKLLNNYRSHEFLLSLSSTLFYDKELIPCASGNLVDTFVEQSFLPNSQYPFIFHGLRGEDYREGNSPSWFNPMEAVQIVKYAQTIMATNNTLTVDDIGIITPYRKQVEKISSLIKNCAALTGIKIGSVEEFQGQERKCILVSTVRSNEELVHFDSFHNIGFLSNPKRFNVAITRAQALLIIVGNPIVLCYDPYWCSMLQYAILNNCYVGCNLPSLSNSVVKENFAKAFQLLGINKIPALSESSSTDSIDMDEDIKEKKTSPANTDEESLESFISQGDSGDSGEFYISNEEGVTAKTDNQEKIPKQRTNAFLSSLQNKQL